MDDSDSATDERWSIIRDIKDCVRNLQDRVEAAGEKIIDDLRSLQGEHSHMRFIRNNSINVLINNHFGFIEIEVDSI